MNNIKLKEEILRISGADPMKCMACGKCTAACPAFDEMQYHPHQFVSMIKNANIAPLLESEASLMCLTCFACLERCPRGVEPAKLVEAVRLVKVREKGCNALKAEDIPCILTDDIPQQALVSAFRKYSK